MSVFCVSEVTFMTCCCDFCVLSDKERDLLAVDLPFICRRTHIIVSGGEVIKIFSRTKLYLRRKLVKSNMVSSKGVNI
jgi:hypothetical protein